MAFSKQSSLFRYTPVEIDAAGRKNSLRYSVNEVGIGFSAPLDEAINAVDPESLSKIQLPSHRSR